MIGFVICRKKSTPLPQKIGGRVSNMLRAFKKISKKYRTWNSN